MVQGQREGVLHMVQEDRGNGVRVVQETIPGGQRQNPLGTGRQEKVGTKCKIQQHRIHRHSTEQGSQGRQGQGDGVLRLQSRWRQTGERRPFIPRL